MPALVYDIGALKVSVNYLWRKRKDGPYSYRRRYPKDVKEILRQRGQSVGEFRTISLRTKNIAEAAKKVLELTKLDDQSWDRIRRGLDVSDVRARAEQLLSDFSLEVKPISEQQGKDLQLEVFFDYLDQKIVKQEASHTESGFVEGKPEEHLLGHEMRALQILNDQEVIYLSDAKTHYLSTRSTDKKTLASTDQAFELVYKVLGDRPIKDYKRKEVVDVVRRALDGGLKTSSVKRRLGTVRAAINDTIRDYELDTVRNAFEGFKIPNLGEDANERRSLTEEQFQRLRDHVRGSSGQTVNMIGMLLYTGARVSEIAGLWLEDVQLDAEVPHIVIHENPLRRLKTKASSRKVPLVGETLIAAQRAFTEAEGSKYLFPRYMSGEGVKNNAASAAMRKVMGRLGCETPHWIRHTLRTMLKNVDVPEPRIKELHGWSRESIADQYGEQTALRNLQEDISKLL